MFSDDRPAPDRLNHQIEVYQINAFADQGASGSPTCVVLDADHLDSKQMLRIARSFDVSHTAFLSQAQRADCDLAIRFFTPKGELRNCAHATIAAHFLRATKFGVDSNQPIRQETSGDFQEVWIQPSKTGLFISFKQHEIVQKDVSAETCRRLCDALEIASSGLHPSYPIRVASPGAFRFMVPLRSVSEVISLRPNLPEMEKLCSEARSIGCFVFAVGASGSSWKAHGRMFAPTIGVDEDVVNGNSSGCLGASLMDLQGGGGSGSRLCLEVLQGYGVGRPSLVSVEARRVGKRIETYVGGHAWLVGAKKVVF